MQNEERKQRALEILSQMGIENPVYLGAGNEGIVFHDNKNVYKVLVPFFRGKDKNNTLRRLSYFTNINGCHHIYKIDEIIEFNNHIIERYVFEPSEPCTYITECEAIDFLVECWQQKIIVADCKPKNFVRIGNRIKLVDLDANAYNDNLFLNMCIRLYLYANYFNKMTDSEFIKLQRSAINNFDLPELQGAREFVNKVFANIIFKESSSSVDSFKIIGNQNSEIFTIKSLPNFEHLFFKKLRECQFLLNIEIEDIKLNDNLYFEPQKIQVSYQSLYPLEDKVTLLIKTCAQDVATVKENIKHIVKQLSAPNPFYEIVVSIDTKERDFLREYNSNPSLQDLINIAKQLVENKVIDRYVLYDNSKTEEINKRWFNLDCKESHSVKNIPVSSQLYAFEQCNGDYILQCDCDIIVGRKDFAHSYHTDTIAELKKNDKVISVGFNIYNQESHQYFGFENGGFVPEVRFGLFDKQRFFALRPFPNELSKDGKLQLSWYRSVEQFQKQTGYCSIRGGDNRSFYVHPQNYRKTKPYSWMTMLDRVEQLQIPECQIGGFDVEGSFYDWCSPKRNEKMVVVSCFRNVSIDRFLRFWCSLMSQSFKDFGIILYDDCSDNGLQFFVEKIIKPHTDKITFISSKTQMNKIQCVHQAIHYYCNNQNSIIVMVDGDDALIGSHVLEDIYKKYEIWGIDVLVGRVHQTYRLQPHYRYPAYFSEPRKNNGGNVWQHLKSFKKYLFDSVPLSYFKHNVIDKVKLSNNPWIEKCDDYAMMIPIVEMSKSPLQADLINYYYERDYKRRDDNRDLKEKCISTIINKEVLSNANVFFGRKTFRPDFKRIEIDITYDCNLKCIGCNRSCAQAPTKEQMDVRDIENFISESIMNNKKWKLINVLGGEPTLHKDFLTIIELLQKYADSNSPETVIQIVSNGISEHSRNLCEIAKNNNRNVVIDYASFKTKNKVEYFSSFNDAPIDDEKFHNADYSKACWVTNYCGIGLNSRGYYACAVCGGIDRVFNTNHGVNSFSDLTADKLVEHYNKFCPLCGNYKAYAPNFGDFIPRCEKEPFKNTVSNIWKSIYGKQNEE